MALRYIFSSNYMRLSCTRAVKYDSATAFSDYYAKCSWTLSKTLSKRRFSRYICTCSKVQSQHQHENNNIGMGKAQASESVKDENWESVSKQGQVDQSEEDEGDTPYVVYLGLLSSQIRHVKLFSLATSAMGLCLQPVIFTQTDTSAAATAAAFTMIGFFTYVTPFLINLVSKKYVCEITFDPKTQSYTSTTYNFFLRKKQLTFQTANVQVPDVPGPFTSFVVNTPDGRSTPLFVAPNTFTRPHHYAKLMGYDKPIDFHLTDSDIENRKARNKLK